MRFGRAYVRADRVQGQGDGRAQVVARNDAIDEAVLEQELGGMTARRERPAEELLGHARSGEADEGFRLGVDDIAETGERCEHATRGRVGQYGDKRQAGVFHLLDLRRGLGHLEQGEQSLLHARAAGADDR